MEILPKPFREESNLEKACLFFVVRSETHQKYRPNRPILDLRYFYEHLVRQNYLPVFFRNPVDLVESERGSHSETGRRSILKL